MLIDFKENLYKLVPDNQQNVKLEVAENIRDTLIIEGFRELSNKDDPTEDLELGSDVLRIFFQISDTVLEESVTLNMKQISENGQDIISIFSEVDTEEDLETLKHFPSINIQLDQSRPHPEGEARCQVFMMRSAATVYKGFTPLLTGFNGENDLIHSITLYSCNDDVDLGPDKCAVFNGRCSDIVFTWYPGTRGEVMPVDMMIKTSKVMLEILYNSGTGWLKDESGMKVFYSTNVADRISHKTVLVNNTQAACDSQLLSVSLHSFSGINSHIKLVNYLDTGEREEVVSGYMQQFQPTRHLATPYQVKMRNILSLECDNRLDCFAIVTALTTDEDFSGGNNCLKKGKFIQEIKLT